jgi:WD40 repeat protein
MIFYFALGIFDIFELKDSFVRNFEGHKGWGKAVCFSPDGIYALSGSADKTLKLWELDWEWEFPNK